MKVGSIGSGSTVTRSKSKNTQSAVNKFSLSLNETSPDDSTVPVTTGIHNINPFLALQQLEYNESGEQSDFITAGETLLNHLRQIILSLTHGNFDIQNIEKLKAAVEQRRLQFNNPELQNLYDEIYLRTSVELEKLKIHQRKNI